MLHKILLIILLLIGLVATVFLVGQKTGFFSKADILTAPQEIKISNISDNSFTISWITAKEADGFVSFGTNDQLGNTVIDDRDIHEPKSRLTHHVTLKNLSPRTSYFYKINTGTVNQQTTAPITENPPAVPEPIFGKVAKQDGSAPIEALIYLQIPGGTLLSSYIREQGNWLVTLNNARTSDLANYANINPADTVDLTIQTGEESLTYKTIVSNWSVLSKITLESSNTNSVESNKQSESKNIFDLIASFLNNFGK